MKRPNITLNQIRHFTSQYFQNNQIKRNTNFLSAIEIKSNNPDNWIIPFKNYAYAPGYVIVVKKKQFF